MVKKFGRSMDKGDYRSEEMGFLLLFILLSCWSNSQVILAACCHGYYFPCRSKEIGGFIIWVDDGRVFYHDMLYAYEYTNNLRGPNEL
jgi:hypothetical protein